jgi:aromatic ring hydroxylase
LQAAIRGVVKLRFMTGLANLVAQAIGRSEMTRYQEMLGTLVANVELAEGLLVSVVHEIWNNVQQLGATNAAQQETPAATFIPGVGSMYGVLGKTLIALTTIRIFLPQAHAQAVDTIRMLGSSGLIMTPTEMDFRNPELNETLSQYLRGIAPTPLNSSGSFTGSSIFPWVEKNVNLSPGYIGPECGLAERCSRPFAARGVSRYRSYRTPSPLMRCPVRTGSPNRTA